MSVLKYPLLFKGSKGNEDLVVLFDSGTSLSCIHPEKAALLGNLERLPDVIHIQTAPEGHEIRAEYAVRLDFYVNGVRLSDEFIVIPSLPEEAIIGAATLQKWRIKLDFELGEVTVDPQVAVAILKTITDYRP